MAATKVKARMKDLLIMLAVIMMQCRNATASMTTRICSGSLSTWSHTLSCPELSELRITRVTFLQANDECNTIGGRLISGTPYHLHENCSSELAHNEAASRCNGRSSCILTTQSIFVGGCSKSSNAMAEIEVSCKAEVSCPSEISGISSESHSKNSHRRPAAWSRDSAHDHGKYYLMPLRRAGGTPTVYEYSTLKYFHLRRASTIYRLPTKVAGTTLVAYDHSFFYVQEKTKNIIKYNCTERKKTGQIFLSDAKLNSSSSGSQWKSDIHIAMDEKDLWATYTTTKSKGTLVASRIDISSMRVAETFKTDILRDDVWGTFVICGNIYAISKHTGRVYKKYDTEWGRSSDIPASVNVTIPLHQTTSVNYNSEDKTLYVWSTSQTTTIELDMVSLIRGTQLTTFLVPPNPGDIFVNNITNFHYTITTVSRASKLDDKICERTILNNIEWPETAVGKKRETQCPDGARGRASWNCTTSESDVASWDPKGPDFSGCATWTIMMGDCLHEAKETGVMSYAAKNLSATVKELKHGEKGLIRSDIHHVADILKELTEIAVLSATSVTSKEKDMKDDLLTMNKEIIKTASALLDEKVEKSWEGMNLEETQKIGSNLMSAIEESAFLLESKNGPSSEEELKIQTENIMIQVDILDYDDEDNKDNSMDLIFPSPSSNSDQSFSDANSLKISQEDVRKNQENGTSKVVFIMYSNLAQFIDDHSGEENKINSQIISASIQSAKHRTNLSHPAIITLEHIEPSEEEQVCVYWNQNPESNTSKRWLSDGCKVVSSNSTVTICSCNHLTSFALLINHQGFEFSAHEKILNYLTWVGLSLSLVCLILCIATFIYFRSLHSTRNTIHTNLCVCLLMSQLTFLIGIDLYAFPTVCSVVAGILHYFLLATFTWMALEGVQLYIMLVEVFEKQTRIFWYYIAGYGFPALFVSLSVGINPHGYGTESACWLQTDVHGKNGVIVGSTPFIWAFIAPASFVAVGNMFFLILTAVMMYVHGRKYIFYSRIKAIKGALKGTVALLFLLGSTWIFGLLWWWEGMVALQYLFCIFNAFQGVYIFMFHCLLHNKVRCEYRRLFAKWKGKRYSGVINSSTVKVKYSSNKRSFQDNDKRKRTSSRRVSQKASQYDERIGKGSGAASSVQNFRDASQYFSTQDRASMKILFTRRESMATPHLPSDKSNHNDETTTRIHQRTFSTRSCPGTDSPTRKRPASSPKEGSPFKRCHSERRHYRGRYNAPVSEGVSRIVKSATSNHNIIPCRYLPAKAWEDGTLDSTSTRSTTTTISKDESTLRRYHVPVSPPAGPNSPAKQFKLVDKRLAKLKKMNSSPSLGLGRSSSLNGAEKKRRELQRQLTDQPSTSVPDLMTQLSQKIENRDISLVLLNYLDADGTLNTRKLEEARRAERSSVGN